MTIRKKSTALLGLLMLCATSQVAALEELSDNELSQVQGREGVALTFDYYFNSQPTGPNQGLANDNCGTGSNYLNCLFTWQIAGREHRWGGANGDAYKGEWLAYKEGYLTMNVNRLALEAAVLGEAKSAASSYESFHNEDKFKGKVYNEDTGVDHNITCLLEDGDCSIASMKLSPALKTYYPDTGGYYDASEGVSVGYNDVRLGLQFERLAVEYDKGTVGEANFVPGYNVDENGSFIGMLVKDNNANTAGIAFGGDFYMYGF